MIPTGAFPDRQAQQEWQKVINWDGVKQWHVKYTPYLLQTPDDEIKLLQYYSQKIRDFTVENQMQYQNLKFDLENTRKVIEKEKERAIEQLSNQIKEKMAGLQDDLSRLSSIKESILQLAQEKIQEEEKNMQKQIRIDIQNSGIDQTEKLNQIEKEIPEQQIQVIEQKFQNDYNDLGQTYAKSNYHQQQQQDQQIKF